MISLSTQMKREEKYEQYLFNEDLVFIRKMLIMSFFFYSLFGITDVLLDVSHINIFIMIRFYIIAPIIGFLYLFSYHRLFYKFHQYLLSLSYTIAGVGIVVMLIISPETFSYHGGLFLVIGYGFTLLRIKWEFALIGSIAIMIIYYVLAFVQLQEYLNSFLIYSLFYIGFIVITMSGSITFEKYRRERYLRETSLKGDKIVLEKEIYTSLKEIETSNYITIYSLAKLAESRDLLTGNHIDRVGSLSLKLAKNIKSSIYKKNKCAKSKFVKYIELASTLHDIGKIGIPDSILNMPSKYTKKERDIMMQHCSLGSTTLREIQNKYEKNNFINMGIQICESHHENWDGTGYPRKLKGTDIPFSARIVAVIDVYDALISERPYKNAWTKEKSINEISRLSGTKFDKDVVDAFIKSIQQ